MTERQKHFRDLCWKLVDCLNDETAAKITKGYVPKGPYSFEFNLGSNFGMLYASDLYVAQIVGEGLHTVCSGYGEGLLHAFGDANDAFEHMIENFCKRNSYSVSQLESILEKRT